MIKITMRLLAALACAQLATASASHWASRRFRSIVTFGDSYTDESRLNYFSAHNGSAPPPGWVNPVNNNTASGGYTWARYVADDADVKLYDYAVSGAMCSNNITAHWFSTINADFPSVLEYEIPAYLADSKVFTGHRPFLDIPPEETVYSMWIGTNDLGVDGFLSDAQKAGKTIPDYTECVFSALDQIYRNGARFFILQNLAPLQLAPLYATPERGGVFAIEHGNSSTNVTEISNRMWQAVTTTNEIYKLQTPFELLVKHRYPGAHFALMDMYNILRDMYFNPDEYFEQPVNVTGFIEHCDADGNNCTRLPNPDSFMWFNSLHPSTRTDSHIAKRYIEVFQGKSRYATYWS